MREISRRHFLVGAAALGAGLVLPGCGRSNPVVDEHNRFLDLGAQRRPNPPFTFGLKVDETAFAKNLHQREADVGRGADVVLTFAKIGDPVRDDIWQLMEAGYDVALTFEYWDGDRGAVDPVYSLKEIAAGRHDEAAARWFEFIATLPRPVYLRPLHEGNGDWYPWGVVANANTVEDYAPAFRHVAQHARAIAGDKVRLQFCVNRISAQARDIPAEAIYPGDDYVDTMVINGYSRPEVPEPIPFGRIIEPFYRQFKAVAPTKPLWIGETACTERHGNKPEWIIEMFAAIKADMPVDSLTWWDDNGGGGAEPLLDWQLDSSPAALAAFKAGINA